MRESHGANIIFIFQSSCISLVNSNYIGEFIFHKRNKNQTLLPRNGKKVDLTWVWPPNTRTNRATTTSIQLDQSMIATIVACTIYARSRLRLCILINPHSFGSSFKFMSSIAISIVISNLTLTISLGNYANIKRRRCRRRHYGEASTIQTSKQQRKATSTNTPSQ